MHGVLQFSFQTDNVQEKLINTGFQVQRKISIKQHTKKVSYQQR
jgi:hypothetical protein